MRHEGRPEATASTVSRSYATANESNNIKCEIVPTK